MLSNVEVTGLSYYPIKSCGAVEADQVAFSEFGIEHDREWILVGSKGQFLSQRTHPELALVQTRLENGSLVATALGMGELAISLERDPAAEEVPVMLWKKPGTGTNEGAEASSYFSEYLGRDAHLLRVQQPRQVRPECRVDGASERTGFADGFPILLASTASLGELNEHLGQPITVDRFRPNIIVEGAPAYDEDYWREVRIGGLRAFVVRACARCPVPNVDQRVGELPKERPVTEALRATRQGIDPIGGEKGEFFGQNIVHVFEPGVTVRVGDTVSVVERASERNWRIA
ncbi:MAG: MOSC N-terminal beta barrel domain-containing protein [Patescibacteria group bacterium]